MESTLIYLILAISAVSLAISLYLALKMKTVAYLLEQPVVKKMSPQLKLKPVKLDELADRNRQPQNRDPRPGNPGNPRHGGPRNDQERQERRPDQNREPRQDRRPERNSEGRPERSEGDRNRNSDRFRDRDRNRGDRGDRRPREFSENREPARESVSAPAPQPSVESPRFESQAPLVQQTQSAPQQHEAPLSPRRPLPATESRSSSESPIAFQPSQENEGSAGFGDGDVQHGRRTQLKKKPRFEFDEAETKTEG